MVRREIRSSISRVIRMYQLISDSNSTQSGSSFGKELLAIQARIRLKKNIISWLKTKSKYVSIYNLLDIKSIAACSPTHLIWYRKVFRQVSITPWVPKHWNSFEREISFSNFKTNPVYVCQLKDATILPATDLVLLGKNLCLNYYLTSHIGTELSPVGLPILASGKKKIAIFNQPVYSQTINLDTGIYMLGYANFQFGHFHYDYLLRLFAYQRVNRIGKDVPVLFETGLHPNIYQMLEALLDRRRIILLDPKHRYHVKKLFYSTHPSFVPFKAKADSKFIQDSVYTSAQCIKLLRSKMLSYAQSLKPTLQTHEKVLISRPPGSRRQINDHKLFYAHIKSFGFYQTDMVSLTFNEQISLISSAQSLIAPIGSAADFLIYLPKTSRCLLLSSPFMGAYPNTLAVIRKLGVDVRIFFGQIDNHIAQNPKQSNFSIHYREFKQALDWVQFK